MKKRSFSLAFVIILLMGIGIASQYPSVAAAATEEPPPAATAEPQKVLIKVADGLEIHGMFYPTTAEKAPALLLLHQYGGNQSQWSRLVPILVENGYNVLTVDMRGSGTTGGKQNWTTAEADGLELMKWLREQPTVNPDRVGVIGASIGSNLALRICAADEKCPAVVALSPGINYFGVSTKDAVENMGNRAVLLVAAQQDSDASGGVKTLTFVTPKETNLEVRIYGGTGLHGVDMLYKVDLPKLIIDWLQQYNQ
jgi:dienelactone hydrolase